MLVLGMGAYNDGRSRGERSSCLAGLMERVRFVLVVGDNRVEGDDTRTGDATLWAIGAGEGGRGV